MLTEYLKKIVRILAGLTVCSFGLYLTIHASLGISPWECLSMGVSKHTPLNFGLAATLISVLILIADIFLKEPVGIGMICDAFYTGNMIQFFSDINLVPEIPNLFLALLCLIVGITLNCYGQYFYMSAGLTCGPRDSFTVGVGKHFRKISIGIIQNIIFVIVFLAGWILDGPVGIGTLITVLFTGTVMNFVFRLVKFEPRNVKHENLMETIRNLRTGKKCC